MNPERIKLMTTKCKGTGKQVTSMKRETRLATLLQKELNSDVTRFTTHVQNCLATNQLVNKFEREW